MRQGSLLLMERLKVPEPGKLMMPSVLAPETSAPVFFWSAPFCQGGLTL